MSIKNILKSIGNFLSGVASKISSALSNGVKIANVIKGAVDSPLLDIAVNLTTNTVDNATLKYLRLKLPVWIEAMGWAEKKLSDFDDTTLPHVLNSIGAEAAKLEAEFKGLDLTRQQAIASIQVEYNPDIVKV